MSRTVSSLPRLGAHINARSTTSDGRATRTLPGLPRGAARVVAQCLARLPEGRVRPRVREPEQGGLRGHVATTISKGAEARERKSARGRDARARGSRRPCARARWSGSASEPSGRREPEGSLDAPDHGATRALRLPLFQNPHVPLPQRRRQVAPLGPRRTAQERPALALPSLPPPRTLLLDVHEDGRARACGGARREGVRRERREGGRGRGVKEALEGVARRGCGMHEG